MQTAILHPSKTNPRYWVFYDVTAPLLGGSSEDNLFQTKGLIAELNLIASVSGNVIRNTMSDRDPGDLRAFAEVSPGRYDLTRWNPAYWDNFETLLRETARHKIAVQIEVWDRFDHSRGPWQSDPWNPANNINYNFVDSGFVEEYPAHPAANLQPFFKTVPAMENNTVVLPYQQAFVRKILEHTFKYGHVLYCMDNETSADPAWGRDWAQFIRDEARIADKQVYLTEMWDNWNVTEDIHRETTDHPERYEFIDLSQNSQVTGQSNWDNAQTIWQRVADQPRPINSTKIYGNDNYKAYHLMGKGSHHAITTFWRNLIGGFATSRFHRPEHGLGISEVSQYQIRSARLFLAEYPIVQGQPDSGLDSLIQREDCKAYVNYIAGEKAAILFSQSGTVILDRLGNLKLDKHPLTLRWLPLAPEISQGTPQLSQAQTLAAEAQSTLSAPEGPGPWLAILSK